MSEFSPQRVSYTGPQEKSGARTAWPRLQMIRRRSGITFFAVQPLAQHACPAGLGNDPRSFDPGRAVADMLEVSASQLRHPMMLFVLMETGNGLFHNVSSA